MATQKSKAYERLKELLTESDSATPGWSSSGKFTEWNQSAQSAMRRIFGDKSQQLKAFNSVLYSPIMFSPGTPESVFDGAFMEGIKSVQAIIRSSIRDYEDYEGPAPPSTKRRTKLARSNSKGDPVRKIFIVHGHDDAMREAVARFLDRLGFDPIILHEQASGGDTIIEKVERNSEVSYAVILLSPDDVGAAKGQEGNLQPRGRQNVILELGYFIGLLGRSRVCALVNGPLEIPSDFGGVVYVPYQGEDWKIRLVRELKHLGFTIDANEAF